MIFAALSIAGSIFSHLSGELLPFSVSENFTQNIVGHFDRRLVRIDVGPTVRVVCEQSLGLILVGADSLLDDFLTSRRPCGLL